MAGSLAETELNLRLYHGPARFELIVKDYQGEDVSLGSDQPIQQFFADCDAVLLCLDPAATSDLCELRRRQQEVEGLLEGYIDRSENGGIGRPVALLLTKFDQVMVGSHSERDEESSADVRSGIVERLLNERYGMTRHAMAAHAPEGGVFAVSSFGSGAAGQPAALRASSARAGRTARLGGAAARGR